MLVPLFVYGPEAVETSTGGSETDLASLQVMETNIVLAKSYQASINPVENHQGYSGAKPSPSPGASPNPTLGAKPNPAPGAHKVQFLESVSVR